MALDLWPEDGAIEVLDAHHRDIATIPIGFLHTAREAGASMCTWDFVYDLISHCVLEEGVLKYEQILITRASTQAVSAGTYVYLRNDDASLPCTYVVGPVSKRRGRKVNQAEGSSTVSNSKRSSNGQSGFRDKVTHRDLACLLTEVLYTACTACHIVPFSRFDLYAEILDRKVKSAYEPWMGVLLRDDIHKFFDRYAFSFYPRGQDYVLHCFAEIPGIEIRAVHGKIIPHTKYDRFPGWKPHPKLLLWHYRQCVQMHLRGVSHGVSPADALEETSRKL